MKKIYLSLLIAVNLIFNEAIWANTNNASKENLDYLFDENISKFPVDDYLYKAGFAKPKDDVDLSGLFNKKLDMNATIEINSTSATSEQEKLDRTKELKRKLEIKQEHLTKEIQKENNHNIIKRQKRIEKLVKDSILAERTKGVSAKSLQPNKFGADGFSNQKSIDVSTNEHRLYRMIRAGRLIPALLTSAISSELSGIVTAQIEEDIYAAMGRAVLIPRGSKAIGFYQNNNKIGQERLEIKWREIVTPQGVNIMLTNAIVADNMGMTGAVGALDNKYFERYGIAYGISTVTNALLLGIASQIKGNNTYVQEIYSDAKSDVSTIVQDIIQQQSQIKPVIEIKSGSRVYLVPTNHMWFSKPKNGEILMKYFEN